MSDNKPHTHFELSSWLQDSNFSEGKIDIFRDKSVHGGTTTVGIGGAGKARILRYDQKNIRNHIQKWLKDKVRVRFQGIKNLQDAAKQGILRQGQLIFEEITIAHRVDAYSDWKGSFGDAIKNSMLAKMPGISMLGISHKFTYFRVAVYVGIFENTHYVVDNDCNAGIGKVTICPMEDAFSKTSTFFVVSPPKVENGRTTRYITRQRALSSVGITYKYHIKAACCEQFGLIMAGLFGASKTIQQEASRSLKSSASVANLLKGLQYNDFHESMMENILSVKTGILLTLDYVLHHYLKPSFEEIDNVRVGECIRKISIFDMSEAEGPKHIQQITRSYEGLMDAILTGNKNEVIGLVNQGLDLGSVTAYGKTALTLAASKGMTDMCRVLTLEVNENYRANVNHKDGHGLTAIEYSVLYGHRDTATALEEVYKKEEKMPKFEKSAMFYLPRDGEKFTVEQISKEEFNMAHLLSIEQHYCLNAFPETFGYFYYEVTIAEGVGDHNVNSFYNLHIGFSNEKKKGSEGSFCHLGYIWRYNFFKKEVIGCGLDNISKTMIFTRNGKPINRPFYLGNDISWSLAEDMQPTIHILPDTSGGKDLQLPTLEISFNFGKSPFEYKNDLKDLFEITFLEEKKYLPPVIANECPLLKIDS